MAIKKKAQSNSSSNSLFKILGYKYIPFWPLFLALILILLPLAFFYTRYLTPLYNVSATMVINDEQRGVQESETLRSLNVYATNTTVENEIQVLTSRNLMNEVVHQLHLYAPVFEKGRLKPASAYLSSPIIIQAKDPHLIKEQESIPFDYNEKEQRVIINGRSYPLHSWIAFPFGVLRFEKNPRHRRFTVRELYFSLINPKVVTSGIGSNLEVSATSKLSSVINLQYKDEVPERGEDIVNQLLDAYYKASIASNNQLASNTLSFVNERIRDVEAELDSIEGSIQQFRSTQGIVDLSQQGRLYLESVAENDRNAADITMQLAVLEQVERYVRSGAGRTGIVPTTLGINDPVLADLLQKLNTLELEYSNLRTRIGQENPMVRSVENEIQKIRPNILGIVRNQRSRLQASLNNYNRSSNQANAMLRTLPGKERQLLDISRQQATKNEVYAFLLQRREEAELSTASTTPNSRVVDRAQASVTPVGSKRMLFLIGALIVAIAAGIGYVFLKENLTSNVLFRTGITRATSFPVIAELAYRKKRKNSLIDLSADPIFDTQLQQLQAAMGLYAISSNIKRILITSNINKEGKTFVSNHLAMSLAATGKKVVLMDLCFQQSETSKLHNANSDSGLTDYLQGSITDVSALSKRSAYNNLYIIPSGTKSAHTSLLFNSRLGDLFHSLSMQFDYLIIDAPAVELSTEALMLSQYVDQTLFIVRHGITPNTFIQKLDQNNRLETFANLSIIFNGVKPRGFLRRYYGYGYGYGLENVFNKRVYKSTAQ